MTFKKQGAARYGLAVASVLAAVLARRALEPLIGTNVAYITVFPVMMIVAVTLGACPGLVSAALGIALIEWFFIGPPGIELDCAVMTRAAILLSTSAYVGWVSTRLRASRAQAETQTAAALAADAALRQQSELMDHADEALIVRELGGVIRFWNQGAAALYDWPASEALGQSTHVLLRTEGVAVEEKDAQLTRTGHWEGELTHTTRDGRRVTVESRQTATHAADGHVLILEANRDITDRKLAEAEREKFVSLADQSAEFIGICDMRYQPLYINEAGLRMVGLENMEQARRTPVLDFFYPEDQPALAETFFPRVLREGRSEMEIRFRHFRTGEPLWMIYNVFFLRDEGGKPVGLATVSRNITQRKQAEEAVSRSEALLRSVTDNTEDLIFVKDAESRMLFLNPAAERIFGLRLEDVMGRTDAEWHRDAAQAAAFMEDDRQVMASRRTESVEETFTSPEGPRVFQTTKAPRLSADGRVAGIVGIARDITERKRIESEREATVKLLQLITASRDLRALAQAVVAFFQEQSGCEAVGLRLREGDDFPYFETRGFPAEFVQMESRLCARDASEQLVRDAAGNPAMECMCGNILCGRFNPELPFFSEHGSFWTNSTTDLLASTTAVDRQARTRNRCNGEGYESVALLPLRICAEHLGLVQLNDRRAGRFNAESIALWERLADHLAVGLAKLRAETTLRESQQKLSAIHDHAPFAIGLMRFPDGAIAEVNAAWEKLFDCTRGKAIGKTALELGLASDPESRARMYEEIRARGFVRDWEMRYRTLAGEERLGSFSFDLIEIGGQKYHLGTAIDITARKRAEDALRESEERVRRKLESVLAPEGDLGVLELADLVDTAALQLLMDDFYPLSHMPMAILDLKGRVLVGVGWQDICTRFHRVHAETCRHCHESDLELSAGLAQGEYRLYKCKNNLWDMATPIIVAGQHVGNIFTGQFFFEDETVDREQFRTQARAYGFDEQSYLAALDRIPRLNRQTVDSGMAFFLKLADTLSQLGYSNVKLARLLAERDRLTESLRQSESFYRQTLESVPGMTFTTRPDGYCDYQSQQWEDFTGVPMSEHLGDGWNKLLHPEDRPRAFAAWCAAVEGRAPYDLEYRVRRRDGVYEWFKVRGRPIRNAAGEIVRWFGTAVNVDGLVQAQAAIRNLNEQLEQRVRERTSQLESANRELEAFCYSVSHDLRTPLRTIDGFSQATLEDYGASLDDTGRDYLNRVLAGCRQMDQLIDDLLNLSRVTRDQMRREPVDLSALAQAVVSQLRAASPGRDVDVRIAPGLAAVGDARLLRTALFNLLENAWKFSARRPDAVIEMGADPQREGRPPQVFFVRDNGVGFDMQYAGKLFNAFQRLHTTKEFPGTGIGLATVARVIQRHGGRIWADAGIGRGATFYFTLAPEPAEPPQ